jgi:trypsin
MKVSRSCTTLAVIVCGCAPGGGTTSGAISQSIFGGEAVTDGPIARSTVMFVAKGGDGTHGCSASIIDTAHALTAAHCVFGLQPGDEPELVLELHVAAGGTRRTVTTFARPNDSFDDDIAVLTFAGGLPVDHEPVALADATLPIAAGDDLVHAGYGQTTATVNDRGTLRAVATRFVEPQPNNRYLASAPDAGICSGDSGGPDYVPNGARVVQLGVHVSGDCQSAGVSSDVRRYLDFILGTGATPVLVSRLDPGPDPDPDPDPGVPPDADPKSDDPADDPARASGGCQTAASPDGALTGVIVVAMLLVTTRRRRAQHSDGRGPRVRYPGDARQAGVARGRDRNRSPR